jgi:two-component system chemotaxis response regulator CheB
MSRIREQLIPKIKALCGVPTLRSLAPTTPRPVAKRPLATTAAPARPNRIDIVAIGVSTGGPNALGEVLPKLPADFPVPIVVVQHMPPVFTKLLADRLNNNSAIDVSEATAGDRLRPGSAWLAPGDFHMTVTKDAVGARLHLNQATPENSCRPAVDPLFRSVVSAYKGNVLAVIMTGMGHDGLRGCEGVVEAGGTVYIQDQATSVVWGMPGAVASAGIAQRALPLTQIASEIVKTVQASRAAAAMKVS